MTRKLEEQIALDAEMLRFLNTLLDGVEDQLDGHVRPITDAPTLEAKLARLRRLVDPMKGADPRFQTGPQPGDTLVTEV